MMVTMSLKANYAFKANDRERALTHKTLLSKNVSKLINGFPIPYISIYGEKKDDQVEALIRKMNLSLLVFYLSMVIALCSFYFEFM